MQGLALFSVFVCMEDRRGTTSQHKVAAFPYCYVNIEDQLIRQKLLVESSCGTIVPRKSVVDSSDSGTG